MSVMTGFIILVIEQVGILWKKINPHAFGIYGATQVGKTTLHHQLRTRGEVPNQTTNSWKGKSIKKNN